MGQLGTIITQTPFRINFFGGGTDFPDYFNRKRGAVLGTTINKYTYVTVNSLERLLEKKIRMSYSKLEIVDDPSELGHDIVRASLNKHRTMLNGGFLDIHSFADLPAGSGVGSSSSFAVGFLNAFYLLNKIYRSPYEIAAEAIEVERKLLKEAGGWQDQIHASYGGFNRIDFHSDDFFVNPVCFKSEHLQALEHSCMFFFTGLIRSSASTHQKGDAKSPTATDKDAYLDYMYESVFEGEKILMTAKTPGDMLVQFGKLLHKNWQAKRQLSPFVSTNEIDQIYETAIEAGALGGKLLGAGSGGFMLFIVPSERQEKVAAALSRLRQIRVAFERNGSRPIFAN